MSRFGPRFPHALALLAVLSLPLLGACSEQERAAADAREKAYKLETLERQQAHQLQMHRMTVEAQEKVAKHEADLAADTARKRNVLLASAAKIIGLAAAIAGTVAALGFWVRQVLMHRAVEAEITTRMREEAAAKVECLDKIVALLRDPESGLTDDQRQALLGQTIDAANRPLLPHIPA